MTLGILAQQDSINEIGGKNLHGKGVQLEGARTYRSRQNVSSKDQKRNATYACFPDPNTAMARTLFLLTISNDEARAVLKAVSSSAFMNAYAFPSLSMRVREPNKQIRLDLAKV
jgi:hypothetical protein